MSQFFISCKESKIENNRSFYGCFNIGPFEPSQSITIANALRRTLLSELYGLSIVSVEIEGATHEYSNLTGVKDSVLDILLNIKDIVLKKTINTIGIKPQIGYLKARGPGIVRASNLKLPQFIQSVDPDQYIATLTHDGFLNMKFVIQYSNKWLSNQNFQSNDHLRSQTKDILTKEQTKSQKNLTDCKSDFNLHLKKRRLILKKLKQMGLKTSNLYINIFSKFIYKQSKKITMNSLYPKIYQFDEKGTQKINKLNTIFTQNLTNSKFDSPWVSYLQVPALKLLKINKNDDSSLEELEFSDNQKKRKIFLAITNLVKKHRKKYPAINLRKKINFKSDSFRDNMNSISEKNNKANYINKFSNFFNSTPLTIDSIFNPVTKVNYIIEVNDFKISQAGFETSHETLELLELLNVSKTETRFVDFADKTIQGNYFVSSNNLTTTPNMSFTKNSNFLENILEIKREINFLKKETPKHNIIFEIWTNGSMHPRDAIYQGFKNLVRIFSKLNKINAFMINPLTLSSLEKNLSGNKKIDKEIKKNYFLKKLKQNEISDTITDPFMLSTELPNLSPLNDISFISTYMAPKLKNFYFSTEANNFKWSQISGDSGIQVYSQSRLLNNLNSSSIIKDESTAAFSSASSTMNNLNNITSIVDSKKNVFKSFKNLNTNKNNIKNFNDQNLEILNLSLRSYTSLKRLNINSIEELKIFLISYNKSSDFKKLSKICFEEIEQSLQKLECNK